MPIYKIELTGVPTFWIVAEETDINRVVETFEDDRGQYGFPSLTSKKKTQVIKDFLSSCPGAKIKYHTILEKQLKLMERTVTWLERRLNENGYTCDYSTVMRWIRGEVKMKKDVIKFITQLLQVD